MHLILAPKIFRGLQVTVGDEILLHQFSNKTNNFTNENYRQKLQILKCISVVMTPAYTNFLTDNDYKNVEVKTDTNFCK